MDPAIADKLLHEAPDALLLADAGGAILFANEAASRLFGYGIDALIGQSIDALLPERYRAAHVGHRRQFASQPEQRTMGHRGVALFGRRQDGSEFPIWVSLSPIKVNGEFQVVAAVRDVSDWESLTQQLRQAHDAAEEANQAKSRFLATASHDLRQPLQALQLLNANLEHLLKDNPGHALVVRQQHAIDNMIELLNALLDISKLGSGTVQVKLEPVPAVPLFEEIREQLESLTSVKCLQLQIDIQDLTLLTDRVLFRQLVQNLLGNAIKYTDKGWIKVRLSRTADHAILQISDTGMGIPRDQLAKIFDAYYQPHATRPDRPGIGLGLAIVKKITSLLGFAIEVESQPGRGTSFQIQIPLECLTDRSPLPTAPPVPAHASAAGACALVIEDDTAVREAIALALELEGLTIYTAHDAASAQQTFRDHLADIDLIVSDYHVDVQHTGVDILLALRQLRTKPLPAVFLTGDTSLAAQTQRSLPDTQLLSKPVDIHLLMATLSTLLPHAGK